MMPAILLSASATVLAGCVKYYTWGSILLSSVNAVIAFLLALVSYFKFDAASESHKMSAHQYDKLQSTVEFTSGSILLFKNYSKINNESRNTPQINIESDVFNKLTDVEKKAYIARGEILKAAMDIADSGTLQSGFDFDINNSLINLTYNTSTIFPGVSSGNNAIPGDLIKADSQKAYISAALIECLIFLASDTNGLPLAMSGGFGSSYRGDDDTVQGANLTPLKSGNSVTDHVFGRAFDINKISIKGESSGNINSRCCRV
jgi:hypothetical protein